MIEFTDAEKLISWLAQQPKERLNWIGVDGWVQAGKSTLARNLARRRGSLYVELDRLNAGRLPYAESIDYPKLARLRACAANKVIEGICLRSILDTAGIAPSLTIYVKKVAFGNHIWHDGENFPSDENAELFGIRTPASRLEAEMASYHYKYRPHEISDVALVRVQPRNGL